MKLQKHNISISHLTCVTKLASYNSSLKSGSVLSNLSSGHQEQIKRNRTYILHLIDIVLYLGKQGSAFRGHLEDSEALNCGMYICYYIISNNILYCIIFCYLGNFKELCKLYEKSVPDFNIIYNQPTNYTSWRIQEELIEICANHINEIIINEITITGFFAIMCDEAR